MHWTPEGKRKRGRPKITWRQTVEKEIKEMGKTWEGIKFMAKALYQAVIKYLNVRVGDDFNKVKAILLAPTGKAAYNIQGKTIHSTFNIPANQNLKNYKSLDSSRLNTL